MSGGIRRWLGDRLRSGPPARAGAREIARWTSCSHGVDRLLAAVPARPEDYSVAVAFSARDLATYADFGRGPVIPIDYMCDSVLVALQAGVAFDRHRAFELRGAVEPADQPRCRDAEGRDHHPWLVRALLLRHPDGLDALDGVPAMQPPPGGLRGVSLPRYLEVISAEGLMPGMTIAETGFLIGDCHDQSIEDGPSGSRTVRRYWGTAREGSQRVLQAGLVFVDGRLERWEDRSSSTIGSLIRYGPTSWSAPPRLVVRPDRVLGLVALALRRAKQDEPQRRATLRRCADRLFGERRVRRLLERDPEARDWLAALRSLSTEVLDPARSDRDVDALADTLGCDIPPHVWIVVKEEAVVAARASLAADR